jgi:hypothetical protein
MLYIVMVMQTDLILNQRLHTVRKGFDVAHIMQRLESLKGTSMFCALNAAARNPALLALAEVYSGVNIGAFMLVSGAGRFSIVVRMLVRVIHSCENRPPVS